MSLKIAVTYLIFINIVGIALMGVDKRRAIKKAWRISEKTFFIVSLIGGSAGSWLGMYLFRHKTKHRYFVVGIPAIFFIQIGLAIFFIVFR